MLVQTEPRRGCEKIHALQESINDAKNRRPRAPFGKDVVALSLGFWMCRTRLPSTGKLSLFEVVAVAVFVPKGDADARPLECFCFGA